MSKKEFSLGAILSVTTDKLMCELGRFYEILGFLGGDSLMTHQLSRAGREYKPFVLKQLPQLAHITGEDIDRENVLEKLQQYIDEFGEFHTLESFESEVSHVDPIEEAIKQFGEERVIIV